jgi:hypothetical protein
MRTALCTLKRILAVAALCSLAAWPDCMNAHAQKTVDQILVLVNDEVITRSDLLWRLALDKDAPTPAAQISSDVLRRRLDVMIDERLVAQEAARIPSAEVTEEELRQKRTDLIKQFKSEAEFRERVGSVGLTRERIDQLLRERILIERFVDFRFHTFVLVTEPEIKKHYDETIVPQVRAQGQVPPTIEEVRERISARLKAEKVNDELDRWLSATRQRADIVMLAEP